jgi:type II secretory pathway pseudopilin PulG
MAALLVGLSIMAVLMSAALPVWSQFTRREREEELIWRGQQYARAVGLFQRKYANTFPPNVDILIEQKFLRKKYKDPITNDDFQLIPAAGMPAGGGVPPAGVAQQPGGAARPSFTPGPSGAQQPQPAQGGQQTQPTQGRGGLGAGSFQPSIGIQGVVSKSKDSSIKVYNGRTKYNEWAFVYLNTALRAGQVTGPGGAAPKPGGQQGTPFGPGGIGPGGIDRRPGVGPGATPRQPSPFGQPPFGQPTPGQPTPGQPSGQPRGGFPPPRPPGG